MSDEILDTNNENNQEDLSLGLKILSVIIPLAGAIMYFVYQKKEPVKAKSACYMALIGAGISIVLNVLMRVMA